MRGRCARSASGYLARLPTALGSATRWIGRDKSCSSAARWRAHSEPSRSRNGSGANWTTSEVWKQRLGTGHFAAKMQGDLDGALLLQAEEERLCRVLGDQDHLRACLGNQADVYRKRGDFGNAWQFAKQCEDIARSLGVADGLRRALEMQVTLLRERASALRALGNLTGELKLLRERERICRELRDFDGVARALAMQATNLLDCGEPAGALTVARTALAIARERGLRDHADHVEQLIAIAQLQAEA